MRDACGMISYVTINRPHMIGFFDLADELQLAKMNDAFFFG